MTSSTNITRKIATEITCAGISLRYLNQNRVVLLSHTNVDQTYSSGVHFVNKSTYAHKYSRVKIRTHKEAPSLKIKKQKLTKFFLKNNPKLKRKNIFD